MPRLFRKISLGLFLVIMLVAASVSIATVHALNWRAKVLFATIKGDIPELSVMQVLEWLKPASPVYLEGLTAKNYSPNAGIHNLFIDVPDEISEGTKQFQQSCAICHGGDAKGGTGPSLVEFVGKSTDWEFFSTSKWGRKDTAMIAQPLTDRQIWQVHAFARSRARIWADQVAGEKSKWSVNVEYAKLAEAQKHPDEWLTYSGDLSGHRHSTLNQINKNNVRDLRVAWVKQLTPAFKPMSATPIVTGGLMYVTEANGGVVALDASNGALVWRFDRPLDSSKLIICCGLFNRGVAVLGNKVFVGTLDAYLVAIDATTGKKLWETKVAEASEGYSITSAPLALDGHILIGVAGAEYGIRGLVAAYSPEDGKRLWQFDAVPAPGEPGNETWAGDSWKTGGASTWSLGSYDQERDVVYWTIGNPWPPFDGSVREGDNLYSNSIVALDRKSGKLLWHFQFTPADWNDWDATQQVILTDINWKGAKVPAILMASRNAFYYALDRRTGAFLYAKPFVKQTWATSMDERGRPVVDLASRPSPKGTLVWPWMHGGTNWWPPSYDAKRHLHFVPTVDAATQYFSLKMDYEAGKLTMGGNTQIAANVPAVMAVKAIDPDTGDVRWVRRLDEGDFKQYSRMTGLVSTEGGIVVAGFEDRLSILDSDTGDVLWKFRPGAQVNAGAMTYAINGKQYISVMSGSSVFAFALPDEDI